MKYKKLVLIVAFLSASWFLIVFVLFNETAVKDVEDKSNKGNLYKKIQELEQLVRLQQKSYKILSEKFEILNQNTQVSDGLVHSLQDVATVIDESEALMPKDNPINEHPQNDPSKDLKSEDSLAAPKDVKLPILVFSCNRGSVSRCLDGLLKYRPDPVRFPIIVSQDCAHQPTASVIRSYGDQVTHIQQPDQSEPEVPPKEQKFKGYFKISRHYSWALRQIFGVMNHSAVIMVEDDLDVAPDFFEYFSAAYPLLTKDPSLWCVSAWNDNGKSNLIDTSHGETLYRSDFFPGLGWMITKELWLELEPKWPKSYWDDWMRNPEQRRNRACIRPEVSRTRTFGKIGVSNGMFFDKHLKFIKLNENFAHFSSMNLSYLMRSTYDRQFIDHVYSIPVAKAAEVKMDTQPNQSPVRISYHTKDMFKNAAKLLGLMDDFKSGVPRTGYLGIVTCFYNGRRVYLAPGTSWKGYDPTWS